MYSNLINFEIKHNIYNNDATEIKNRVCILNLVKYSKENSINS